MRATALVALGAVAVVVAGAPSSAMATYPGANGEIAFELTRTSADGMYTIHPDGSDLQRLTGPNASEPAWSPDGQRIAFVREFSGNGQIFTMNSEGTGVNRVTHGSGDLGAPSFSPSGDRIVFSGARASGGARSIFSVNVDGADRQRLVPGGNVDDPSYSVSGQLVFTGHPAGRTPNTSIWTASGDGSHLRRLTFPGDKYVYDVFPDWSPDGTRIAALRCNAYDDRYGQCAGPAMLIDPSSGHVDRFYGSIADWAGASFAPNGNRVVLARDDPFYYDQCGEMYMVPIKGSHAGRQQVMDTCSDGTYAYPLHPAWRPLPGG